MIQAKLYTADNFSCTKVYKRPDAGLQLQPKHVKLKVSHNMPRWPKVKAPDFLDVRHYEGDRSSALRTGRLYAMRNPWYSFLEAESTPGHMVPSVATEKFPSDTTGNRSRDRPTSSAVP